MFEKLVQIFKIKELRNKVLFIFGILVVFRLAANIPLPGIDQAQLIKFFQSNQLFGLLNLFSENIKGKNIGGAIHQTSGTIFFLLNLCFISIIIIKVLFN